MEFFIKKLGSNESGYSGDSPDQRGKFILIPKDCYDFFPPHSSSYLNDITIIDFLTPTGNIISRKYDWHNAKYHLPTNASLNRDHDEKRIYRSNSLDEDLSLDRHIFFICSKTDKDDKYYCFSVQKNQKHYNYLDGKYKSSTIIKDKIVESIFNERFKHPPIDKEESIIEEDIMDVFLDDKQKKTVTEPDRILTSSQFRALVMKSYDKKCCVREDSVVFGDKIILEAAHIKPKKSHDGLNIPSNGIALSYDLHKMFDEGMWTLTDKLEVFVHPQVIGQSLLGKYHKKKIKPKLDANFFQPDIANIKIHRDQIYGNFNLSK